MPFEIPSFDLSQLEQWLNPEYLPLLIGGVVIILLLFFIMQYYSRVMLLKRMVRRYARQRKKKYNGERLIEKIDKKRKIETNNFKGLKGKGKKLVKGFFKHKYNELKYCTILKTRGKFRFKGKQCLIQIEKEKKEHIKKENYNSAKHFIRLCDKYDCLDQFILYLHELPEQLLQDQIFEYYIADHDATITYIIK